MKKYDHIQAYRSSRRYTAAIDTYNMAAFIIVDTGAREPFFNRGQGQY